MSILDTGPCQNWPPICDDLPDPDDLTPKLLLIREQAIQIATEALWNRTKRRFGLCTLTLRPCREDCWPNSLWGYWAPFWNNVSGWGWPFPALVGGTWINLACGACGSGCSCTSVSETLLPYPVSQIEQVLVDGAELDPSAYRVDNHHILVRTDGNEWPRCNDLNLDDTEAGTWSVRASYGEMVPTMGQLAVGQLASQIYLSCTGQKCGLPSATVQQITRQGVTKVFFDANSAFQQGRIGLYWPDVFIATYNPSGTGTASVFDIDGPRRHNAGSLPGPTPP